MDKEKKEIWKLIELLNEYEPYIASDGEHRDNLWGYVYQWHSAIFPKEIWMLKIISKEYWFIKWLVENDKIDWLKFYGENEFTPIWVNAKSDIDQVYSVEEQILMVLSISDTPIEDLVSYLK